MNEGQLRKIAYASIALLTLVSVFFCNQIITNFSSDYNFEKFFPQNDPETDFFLQFRDKFETDNDFILFGIGNEEGIFQEDFLRELNRLNKELSELKYVTDVQGPTTLKNQLIGPTGLPFSTPILHFEDPEKYKSDSIRIYNSPDLVNSIFSSSKKHVSVLLNHDQYLSKVRCDSLSEQIENTLNNFHFDEIHTAGRAVGQRYFVQRIEMELVIFVSCSIFLISIFLIIAFRSFWGVLVPLTIVLLTVIWLVGLMVLNGKAFDILLTIIPTIVFVVGMSDVVHIVSKYFDELRFGKEKFEALKIAFKEIGIATFLTSITTAIGFLTLVTSSILPLRDFGMIAATGVFLAYILAYTLLPAVLVLVKPPKVINKKPLDVFWTRKLHFFFLWIIRNRKKIAIGSIGALIICLWGISRIEVNNFLLEDLRDNDPMKMDFVFFEDVFAGVRPFEMSIKILDEDISILHPEVLMEIDKIENYLQEEYGIGFIVSPTSAVKMINKANHSGKQEYYKLPDNGEQFEKLSKQIGRFAKSKNMRSLITEEQDEGRLFGKMGDWGAIEIKKRDLALDEYIQNNIKNDLIEIRQTGTAKLIDLNNEYLSATMIKGLMIAFAAIALIVGLMFRSVRMVLISLVPNVFPLLMVGAFMGYTGIDLKVSTAIIFTIAFGIAVDDTIHFLSRLKLETNKGKSLLYATKRTFLGTGKAIIITSLILVAGFLSLMISTFKGTFYTGLLVSLTLFFAVFSDLLLIPILLWAFGKKNKK